MRRVRRSLPVFPLLLVFACGGEEPADTPYDLVIVNGRVIDPESGLVAVVDPGGGGAVLLLLALLCV